MRFFVRKKNLLGINKAKFLLLQQEVLLLVKPQSPSKKQHIIPYDEIKQTTFDPKTKEDFTIVLDGGFDLQFQSAHRAQVLEALARKMAKNDHLFGFPARKYPTGLNVYQCTRLESDNCLRKAILEVHADGIYEKGSTGRYVFRYEYVNLLGISITPDNSRGVIIEHTTGKWLYFCGERMDLVKNVQTKAKNGLGIKIPYLNKETDNLLTVASFKRAQTLQDYLHDDILFQLEVRKKKPQDSRWRSRQLVLTSDGSILELNRKNFLSYKMALENVFAIIIYARNLFAFRIMYCDGSSCLYFSEDRNHLVCSLIEFSLLLNKSSYDSGIRLFSSDHSLNFCVSPLNQSNESAYHYHDALKRIAGMKYSKFAARIWNSSSEVYNLLDDVYEFNTNAPTNGLVNVDKKTSIHAVRNLTNYISIASSNVGGNFNDIALYFQSIFYMISSRDAFAELVTIIKENLHDFVGSTLVKIVGYNDTLMLYWFLSVLQKLLAMSENGIERDNILRVLLSNNVFLTALMKLLDGCDGGEVEVYPQIHGLPLMVLCKFIAKLLQMNRKVVGDVVIGHLIKRFRTIVYLSRSSRQTSIIQSCKIILPFINKQLAISKRRKYRQQKK